MFPINYKLLSENGIFLTDLKESIAKNRGLPEDWCKRTFSTIPSIDFGGFEETSGRFKFNLDKRSQIQIIVDSDLDGIASATILYKFLKKFYPSIEIIYSIHTGKQHGLSSDIKIDELTELVILPDAGSNDVEQACALDRKGIDVICFDHHIMEQPNPYASIVNCMDGGYPNQNLCGAAVTWLFLYGFMLNRVQPNDDMRHYLLSLLDLVAVATISDIMTVTNEDNMYFIQHGLSNVNSKALKAFLQFQEIPLDDVTVEHIKFKVSPLVSAMIRMGSMEEKTLLFRAFIDDYEEFDYEKRGSLGVETENIYDRVVRFCKNAKSRQDRAKQKLIDNCQVHEYDNIILVEYPGEKASTLTGLVANELANQYCKPCIVYHQNDSSEMSGETVAKYSGSIRNYDGSPIASFKDVLEFALGDKCDVQGHDNAAGLIFNNVTPDEFAERFSDAVHKNTSFADDCQNIAIGEKQYVVDFEVDAEDVDAGFVSQMVFFDHYSGYGFAQVSVLVHNIPVDTENFKTMGKNSLSWKVSNDGVDFIKFKIDKTDYLLQSIDDLDLGFTSIAENGFLIDAICTFSLNIYKGTVTPQAIVKDYEVVGEFIADKPTKEYEDDFDLDLGI